MNNNELLDNDFEKADNLRIVLNKLRIVYLLYPAILVIGYLFLELFLNQDIEQINWYPFYGVCIGTCIGTALGIIFRLKPQYIYYYAINENILKIFLVNMLGKKEELVTSFDEIEIVKYRKKSIWMGFDVLALKFKNQREMKKLILPIRNAGNQLEEIISFHTKHY